MSSKKRIVVAVVLAIAFIGTLVGFGAYKDVQAAENLAERSAIPKEETEAVSKMIEDLGSKPWLNPDITVSAGNGEIRAYAEVSPKRNVYRQIALIALNPLASSLLEENAYHLTGVEVKWENDGKTITLKGDLQGWNTIEWETENYKLSEIIPSESEMTIEQAENYVFQSAKPVKVEGEVIA